MSYKLVVFKVSQNCVNYYILVVVVVFCVHSHDSVAGKEVLAEGSTSSCSGIVEFCEIKIKHFSRIDVMHE